MGWAIGGVAAVIDSTIAVNTRFHNTLWVPAHFHTYYLMGVVLMILGAVYRLATTLTSEPENVKRSRIIAAHLLPETATTICMRNRRGLTARIDKFVHMWSRIRDGF